MEENTVAPAQAGAHTEHPVTRSMDPGLRRDDGLEVSSKFAELDAVHLKAPDGAEAIITLYGAHLVSWKTADGRERMFLSAKSALDGTKAIRGGIPVIFPQFATRGAGMRHGFARVLPWRVTASGVEDGAAFAIFTLADSDLPATVATSWPHKFTLTLYIVMKGSSISMSLNVRNDGDAPFPFAAALHTYHLVDDLSAVRIDGVQPSTLTLGDKLDEVFEGIHLVTLASGAGALRLEQAGFTDAVVWNPGAADTAAMSDMEADEYKRFVCIEPALLGPATLEPGQAWHGRYNVSCS
ncbi:D-hexose-6-phosphate mutarotase [Massilia terrae]|uniref:Putative glucose-6-phosphate 1-epimerase n=1 Tax=Massilia terrae TaxID=1811224 RepID=A0ABT2CWX3_9BURK|nr:D-hexose-6-phosphate mutarotase [Massilia terrae]MCS0658468.1 D-hexose-6-phosphate mutarotase [Massilia terrae]